MLTRSARRPPSWRRICSAAVSEVLTRLGFLDFTVRVNHRRALSALLERAGVPEPLHGEALVAIDKLDKIGVEGVEKELLARGVDTAAARACTDFFGGAKRAAPGDESALERLRQFVAGHSTGQEAVGVLDEILRLSEDGPAAGHLKVDPSLARGLSYYTGAIMEIAVPDLAGSLGGGGRYDNLVGMFLGRDVPACGFSLGLERIIVVMTERQMFPASVAHSHADVMVTIWNKESFRDALALASDLRRARLARGPVPGGGQTREAVQVRLVAEHALRRHRRGRRACERQREHQGSAERGAGNRAARRGSGVCRSPRDAAPRT